MVDTKIFKAKNNESGTLTALLSIAEVGTISLTPVPQNAPGVIALEAGTAKEEHIYYKTRDAITGTVGGLIRDYTNLNGGVGQQHENTSAWETMQSAEYLNNVVDALEEGYIQEQNLVAFASATTFTASTDRTGVYTAGRVVRLNNSTITRVVSSVHSTGTTTVTVTGTVPNPLSIVEMEIISKGKTDYLDRSSSETVSGQKTLVTPIIDDALLINHESSVATPAVGKLALYAKSDDKIYKKTSAGVETEVGAISGGGSGINLLKNGAAINNSTNGYGGVPDDMTGSGTVIQGGFPELSPTLIQTWTTVSTANCMGLWTLNGNFTDQSSNGYNLTASGSPTDTSSALMAQGKAFASASSQYADNAAANTRIAGNQTHFGFIKLTTGGTLVRAFGNSDTTNTVALSVNSSNQLVMDISGLTPSSLVSDVVLEAGKWYFVAIIWDSSNTTLKLWCNGIKKQSTGVTGTHTAGTGNYAVGRAGNITSNTFNGTIQAVGCYNVAFTDAQVLALFKNTLYSGLKLNGSASATLAFINQALEQGRGKSISMAAEIYQDTASTATLRLSDGTDTDSSTSATTGSWIIPSVTKSISSTAQSLACSVRGSSGNIWVRFIRAGIGSGAPEYSHSNDDWARFPKLLQMQIHKMVNAYSFEVNRTYTHTSTVTGLTVSTLSVAYRVDSSYKVTLFSGVFSGTSNATGFTGTLPAVCSTLQGDGTGMVVGVALDNTAYQTAPGHAQIAGGATTVTFGKTLTLGAWTASGIKRFCSPITYDIEFNT